MRRAPQLGMNVGGLTNLNSKLCFEGIRLKPSGEMESHTVSGHIISLAAQSTSESLSEDVSTAKVA
jgi:hypothetical protein